MSYRTWERLFFLMVLVLLPGFLLVAVALLLALSSARSLEEARLIVDLLWTAILPALFFLWMSPILLGWIEGRILHHEWARRDRRLLPYWGIRVPGLFVIGCGVVAAVYFILGAFPLDTGFLAFEALAAVSAVLWFLLAPRCIRPDPDFDWWSRGLRIKPSLLQQKMEASLIEPGLRVARKPDEHYARELSFVVASSEETLMTASSWRFRQIMVRVRPGLEAGFLMKLIENMAHEAPNSSVLS